MSTRLHHILVVLVAHASLVYAGGPTKEECIDAHGKGQDAREAGKLSLARKLFLTCAQSTCPELIQGDCAKFTDDLDRAQPTVSFVARDGSNADLPDTAVYVDGVLVATRLDDGRPHEVDPGNHHVRFVSAGKEEDVVVVLSSGEKGRIVTATFAAINAPKKPPPIAPVGVQEHRTTRIRRPLGATIAIGVGGAALLTGAVITTIGIRRVPSNCSIWSKQCDARLGDPVFTTAGDAVTTVDVGVLFTVTGAAVLGAGIVWYIAGAHEEQPPKVSVAPWVAPGEAGFAVGGRW